MITNSLSDDSKSSDDEFWTSFEKPEAPKKSQQKIITKENLKFVSLRPTEKERYEKTITNIRFSKEEEIRNLKIKIENKTKKELFDSINEVKLSFQKEALRLQDTYADSRQSLQKKDNEIISLISLIGEQGYLISKMRVAYRRMKKNYRPQQPQPDEELKSQVQALKIQVGAYKLLCEQYRDEVDKYKNQNSKLTEENIELKNQYEKISNDFANFSNEQCEKAKKEKEDAITEFNKYKLQVSKEVEVRELLNIRQTQIISTLQDELKNAKIILNSPRMRYKLLERLKDVEEKEVKDTKDAKEIKEINESKNSERSMMKAKTNSVTKYPQSFKARSSNYSYKEYKAFESESSSKGLFGLRPSSITPRLERIQNRSKAASSNDSRQKFSKKSVLFYSNTEEF
ncbi:hypothetical protein SteCoe_25789 [Stentor coeruleus]|uniref:Uncharacterized protein n=1 Tax=Stentor coeruleus TaxID=5963 RepID=A0A1R2BEE2_9CILI|nr:hypothetical protein SteCoe_25789 [Stentor coeruleus]